MLYEKFIKEASSSLLDMIRGGDSKPAVKTTTFDRPRKPKGKLTTFTKFKSPPKVDTKEIDKGISVINSIAAKYNAYVEPHTVKGHVVDRFTREGGKADREYNMDDIVMLFKGIERNSRFFDELEKISSKKGGDKGRRANLIDTTRKTHVVVHVTKKGNGYQIVARSLMGNYKMSYINKQKKSGISVYFTR